MISWISYSVNFPTGVGVPRFARTIAVFSNFVAWRFTWITEISSKAAYDCDYSMCRRHVTLVRSSRSKRVLLGLPQLLVNRRITATKVAKPE